jgi:hypothetical protein
MPDMTPALTDEELAQLDAWWRACNYLAAGMIYLRNNPLLREPLAPEHIKRRLLGYWGSSPGLAFIYTHLKKERMRDAQLQCRRHAEEDGTDAREVADWRWPGAGAGGDASPHERGAVRRRGREAARGAPAGTRGTAPRDRMAARAAGARRGDH